jgi:hypothetical protein
MVPLHNGTWNDSVAEGTHAHHIRDARVFSGDRYVDDPPPWKWSDLRYVFDIKED